MMLEVRDLKMYFPVKRGLLHRTAAAFKQFLRDENHFVRA